jgi:hypothetical protein
MHICQLSIGAAGLVRSYVPPQHQWQQYLYQMSQLSMCVRRTCTFSCVSSAFLPAGDVHPDATSAYVPGEYVPSHVPAQHVCQQDLDLHVPAQHLCQQDMYLHTWLSSLPSRVLVSICFSTGSGEWLTVLDIDRLLAIGIHTFVCGHSSIKSLPSWGTGSYTYSSWCSVASFPGC